MPIRIDLFVVLNAAQMSRWTRANEWPTPAIPQTKWRSCRDVLSTNSNFLKRSWLIQHHDLIWSDPHIIPLWIAFQRWIVCLILVAKQVQNKQEISAYVYTHDYQILYRCGHLYMTNFAWQHQASWATVGLWTCWACIICFMSSTLSVCPSLTFLSFSLSSVPSLSKAQGTTSQGQWQSTEN